MAQNYWRIGVKYVDLEMFKKGYPYVWGDGVTKWGYLDKIKNVKPGDILVAGSIEHIQYIGRVKEEPVYLFADNTSLYSTYSIKPAADKALVEAFEPLENDYSDVVSITVDWLKTDCSLLRMPLQNHGGIQPLTEEGVKFIEAVLQNKTGAVIQAAESHLSPQSLLDFTAIDFETGSGYRNSVCQIGLVKVVNGIIAEEYCALIKPPNNFIREDFTENSHGIYPKDTENMPSFAESYPKWKHLVEGQVLVGHNMKVDLSCLTTCLKDFCNIDGQFKTYCTMRIWSGAFENNRLDTCCTANDIELIHHHNALADAEACAKLFILAVNTNRDLRG
jgi:DNA polymerase-3 subunit epsilon